MARTRRGHGRRGLPLDDLQNALGSLLRTTLREVGQQVGVVRDVALRQAQSSRSRFDEVMFQRRRRDAMARLGEAVYELFVQGRLGELEEFPELSGLVADIEELDATVAGSEPGAGYDDDYEAVSSSEWRPPAASGRGGEARVWRPVMPDGEPGSEGAVPDERAGQVASAEDRPRSRPSARAVRLGRQGGAAGRDRGGIAFVSDAAADPDDEDLAEYMHEDDVPGRDREP